MEGGNTLEDTLELLSYFQEEVDAFDVSAGLNGSLQFQIDANYLKDGWRSYMAKAVREKYNKPCVTMGNIRDPRVADDILARGDADIIGMGRGLIADPHWVKKLLQDMKMTSENVFLVTSDVLETVSELTVQSVVQ